MNDLITFFDVETPNKRNDRICSIGLVRTDLSGNTVDERHVLIDPEVPFDDCNMRVHGICGSDVEGMETFSEAWEGWLGDILLNGPVVAHNAAFDLCVLSKAHMAYFGSAPEFSHACTMDLAKRYVPSSPSCKLPDVCSTLGVSLGHHHNALDDARACASVFWAMKGGSPDFAPEFRTYKREKEYEYVFVIREDGSSGFERVEVRRSHHQPRRCSDKNMVKRFFISLLKDVMKDGEISIDEVAAIQGFIENNEEFLADSKVISSLSEMMQEVAMDGVLDEIESDTLQEMIQRIIDPASQSVGNVQIEGKSFIVTGTFRHGTRDTVHNYITSRGGTIAKGVSRKCDYVVIGDYGSEAYSLEQYGTKVQKALALQEKGVPIQIIKEPDLYGQD